MAEIDPKAELHLFKKRYEQGDKLALTDAIVLCQLNHEPLPEWILNELASLTVEGRAGKFPSWDDVLGKPWGEGQQRAARTNARRWEVAAELLVRMGRGDKMIAETFEDVGRATGVGGKSTVARLWSPVARAIKHRDDEE